ncbi:tetratricopeptide repeat protein [Chloroflexota bacterium]
MPEPINAKVASLIRQANSSAAKGNYAEAQALATQAVESATNTFHKPSQTAAYYTCAMLLWSDEHAPIAKTTEYAQLALDTATPHTEEYYMALTLLARVEAGTGNFERAESLTSELLNSYRRKNRRAGIADALRSFGDLALKQDNLTAAHEYFEESLALYENEIDDPINQSGLLLSLGSLAYQEGNLLEAQRYWETAEKLGQQNKHQQIIDYAQQALAILTSPANNE